jgi:predicted transcriptional regulator
MHANSLAAYRDGGEAKIRLARAVEVAEAFRRHGPMTDRQCARVLGYPHKSAVQPRISELVKAGVLRDTDSCLDDVSGKTVRVCAPRPYEQQMLGNL